MGISNLEIAKKIFKEGNDDNASAFPTKEDHKRIREIHVFASHIEITFMDRSIGIFADFHSSSQIIYQILGDFSLNYVVINTIKQFHEDYLIIVLDWGPGMAPSKFKWEKSSPFSKINYVVIPDGYTIMKPHPKWDCD